MPARNRASPLSSAQSFRGYHGNTPNSGAIFPSESNQNMVGSEGLFYKIENCWGCRCDFRTPWGALET